MHYNQIINFHVVKFCLLCLEDCIWPAGVLICLILQTEDQKLFVVFSGHIPSHLIIHAHMNIYPRFLAKTLFIPCLLLTWESNQFPYCSTNTFNGS